MSQPDPDETVNALPDDVRASLAVPTPPPETAVATPATDAGHTCTDDCRATTPGATHRVDLGDGDWADVKDPKALRSGDRKKVIRMLDGNGPMGASAVAMTDEVMKVAVLAWSLPLPVPSADASSLDQLTISQEDALTGDPVVLEITNLLVPSVAKSPTQPSTDPQSPTRPSGA